MNKQSDQLSLRQMETLLSIAKRSAKRERVDTHRYLWGTLSALERRGLVEFFDHGFYIVLTAAGDAIIASDATVMAERLAGMRSDAAWKYREALYKIVKAPKGALADAYSVLGLGATHDLLNAGLIETCIAGTPAGHYHGEGVGVGGVRLTAEGVAQWEKVSKWVEDPILAKAIANVQEEPA